jgi:hypothetical protein
MAPEVQTATVSAVRRAALLAVIASALGLPSCQGEPASHDAAGPIALGDTSDGSLADSPGASARIAELRARFRITTHRPALGAPAAWRFEPAGARDAQTHVRASIPNGALAGLSRPATVALPRRAPGAAKLEDEASHVGVTFALEHVQDTPIEVASGMAIYRGALSGADVLHRIHAEGTEDFVVFETRPSVEQLSYTVDVSRVAGLRLVASTLEFLDTAGAPRLRVAPPYVIDEAGTRHEASLTLHGCAYDASPASPFRRPVTTPGSGACTVRVAWSGVAYPLMVDPAWTTTGSMAALRYWHSASVLASGQVLVAGGDLIDGGKTAELYDPGAGAFSATGSMTFTHKDHTASVLSSGKVLLVGDLSFGGGAGTDLYDPSTGLFSATGSLTPGRYEHTAAVLASGKVLIAGGYNSQANQVLQDAQLYDPNAGTFTTTGSLGVARANHTATVLASGKVLIVGGTSAELYDAKAGTFSPTAGAMVTPRSSHTSSLLPSGKVLIAGGTANATYDPLTAAEIYDEAADTFTSTGSLTYKRFGQTATVLSSGKVLLAGGAGAVATEDTAELYDPATKAFSSAGTMAYARERFTASLLSSGRVLVVGGIPANLSAELFGGAKGDACTSTPFCISGFCVDARCCDSECTGGCDRCDLPGKDGSCSVVPKGNAGANPACVAPYVCDGVGATCPSSCTSDAACADSHYCAADGTCKPRKVQGAACDEPVDCKASGCRVCASAACVDGFCCDRTCAGGCEACAASLKQSPSADGACGPIRDGTDPRDACVPSGDACGADGHCNGTGACRLWAAPGVACDVDKICDGAGACVPPPQATCDGDHTAKGADGVQQDCTPYRCGAGGACFTSCQSVADCAAPNICDATGKCSAAPNEPASTGCAVTAAGTRARSHGLSVPIVGIVLGVMRRRRRARTP